MKSSHLMFKKRLGEEILKRRDRNESGIAQLIFKTVKLIPN